MVKQIQFDDLKVIYKLGVLVIVAFLMMGIIASSGYRYLQRANNTTNALYTDGLLSVKDSNQICASIGDNKADFLELMLTTDANRKKQLLVEMDAQSQGVTDALSDLGKLHLDTKAKTLLNKVQATREQYIKARVQAISLVAQNKNSEAYACYLTNIDRYSVDYLAALREFSDYCADLSKKMNEDSQVAAADANHTTLIVCVAAFLLLGWSAWTVTKRITKPLSQMAQACEEMAGGDFRDKPGQMARRDEFGQVVDSLAAMRTHVRTLMKAIDLSVEQVAAASEELTAGAEQSSQAATQVAVAITGVAQGMTQQLEITG